VVAGLAIGSIYGLVGIGYTVVFNATRVFNLAQGDLVMVGVMGSYLTLVVWKLPWLAALVIVLAGVAAIAAAEERFVVRPFLKKTGAASFGWFIATLGFTAMLEAVVNILFGHRAVVAIPTPLSLSGLHIGSVQLGYRELLIIGTFIVVIVVLDLFYAKSWLGQAMRGTAEDREAASLRGINPVSMSRTAFIMALAIGGFGSIRGAVVGGLTLGVCEQLFDAYVSSNYVTLVGLILVLLVLTIRPEGLFRSTVARTV
jgi:branched-subunit amino acid ABC-type transport system permease component